MSLHKNARPQTPQPDNSELIARLRTDAEELARIVIYQTEQLTGEENVIGSDPDECETPLEAAPLTGLKTNTTGRRSIRAPPPQKLKPPERPCICGGRVAP